MPMPIFAVEDWALVWVWPLAMALIFGVFVRHRDVVPGGDRRRPTLRFLSSFSLFSILWVPTQIVGNAFERGGEASGYAWPVAWGVGAGAVMMAIAFGGLILAVSRSAKARAWLGLGRFSIDQAGRS